MRKQRAERLRFAVNSLPPETQRAMLEGIDQHRIVTGANSDRRGGLCPMLAADRDAFAVTPLAEIFASAWDRYTGTSFVNVNRRTACERDLKVLRSMLETSLATNHAAVETTVAVSAPAPGPVAPPAIDPAASEAVTVAARLEVIRALEATGTLVEPAARVTLPTPRPASWVEPAPAAPPVPAPRRAAASIVARADGRAPAAQTTTERERQRARAIVANQASTLRSRVWPRQQAPADVAPSAPLAAAAASRPSGGVSEQAARSGWNWLRPFKSYDEYEQTLTELGETRRDRAGDDGGVRRDDTKRREPTHA